MIRIISLAPIIRSWNNKSPTEYNRTPTRATNHSQYKGDLFTPLQKYKTIEIYSHYSVLTCRDNEIDIKPLNKTRYTVKNINGLYKEAGDIYNFLWRS